MNGAEEIVVVLAHGSPFYSRFDKSDYLFRKSGFELSVDRDGRLFKRRASWNANYEARLWDLDRDEEPIYLDWAIGL